jgi:16S rRNA (cytidine1402-2'-O)-methyltransferase
MTAHSNNRSKSQAGELSIVATPIGNLGDITLRALETLKNADLIACEDTRTTATLLHHYGITTPTTAYHMHNEAGVSAKLIKKLQAGDHIALVSDAGTPLLSDPGGRLVSAAIAAQIRITPLPGASALLAALTIAGLPASHVYFAGFLPTKAKERSALLRQLAPLSATLIFYEAPHRLVATLTHLSDGLGDRPAAVARELTKKFEECQRSPLSVLTTHYSANPPKGECVILIAGATAQAMDDEAIDAALRSALARLSLKQAVEEVAASSGRPKRSIYQRALELADAQ